MELDNVSPARDRSTSPSAYVDLSTATAICPLLHVPEIAISLSFSEFSLSLVGATMVTYVSSVTYKLDASLGSTIVPSSSAKVTSFSENVMEVTKVVPVTCGVSVGSGVGVASACGDAVETGAVEVTGAVVETAGVLVFVGLLVLVAAVSFGEETGVDVSTEFVPLPFVWLSPDASVETGDGAVDCAGCLELATVFVCVGVVVVVLSAGGVCTRFGVSVLVDTAGVAEVESFFTFNLNVLFAVFFLESFPVTVILQFPAAFAFTTPFALTVATLVLLDLKVSFLVERLVFTVNFFPT